MSLTKVNYINNQTIITASNLNDIQDNIIENRNLIHKVAPRNLLDNSDFRNPVNQRDLTSYTGAVYGIDRWVGAKANVTVNSGYITIDKGTESYGLLCQYLASVKDGKIYTFMAKNKNGEIAVLSTTLTPDMSNKTRGFSDGTTIVLRRSSNKDAYYCGFSTSNSTMEIEYCALYEGEYTAETLPEYQPKGYAAELAECQRYYYKLKGYWKWAAAGICTSATQAIIPIKLPQAMRVKPTATIKDTSLVKVRCGAVGAQVPSSVTWESVNTILDTAQMSCTVTGATNGNIAFLYLDNAGCIEFSADL